MGEEEGEGEREQVSRKSCKEIPWGWISPASEHINRSQSYSQSKGG